jgi:hypothetical protein
LPIEESSEDVPARLQEIARNLGIGRIQRHIFLCADQTKAPDIYRQRSRRAKSEFTLF